MNIGIITSRYPSENKPYNHMFVHVRSLEIKNQGHKVCVFVPNTGNTVISYNYEGVTVFLMPSLKITEAIMGFNIIALHILNIYPFTKKNGLPIYKYLIREKVPFVMHIHGNEVQKYTARIYEFNYRITDFLKWIKKDFFVIPVIKKIIKKSIKNNINTFVFPSKWMKEESERNLKVEFKKKYEIIPTGIEVDFFKHQNNVNNRFKIITIRSLSNKVYDIEKTIEVLSLLPEKFTLDIYGEGIYCDYYKFIIKKKNLQDRVKIISGFLEKDDMRNVFSNYGVYISTTKMDSQGVNMMEAMAAGLLVATTDNSSKREFISNFENGILGETALSIAEGIKKATNNEHTYTAITKKGRRFIETISIKETVKKELFLYNKMIER